MRTNYQFSISSHLGCTASELWGHAITPQGINRELFPLLKMTSPKSYQNRSGMTGVPLNQKLFRSWILLFGVIPVEYDDITVVEMIPEQKFVEVSTMCTQKVWRHERRFTQVSEVCEVTDQVTFEPKLKLFGPVQLMIFRLVFQLRHKNLKRIFPVL